MPKSIRTLFVLATLIVSVLACSSSSDGGTSTDKAGSCKDLCTKAGFTSSRLDEQPNEINCFCTGGSGNVDAKACTDMCTGFGKKGATFKTSNQAVDACQCD